MRLCQRVITQAWRPRKAGCAGQTAETIAVTLHFKADSFESRPAPCYAGETLPRGMRLHDLTFFIAQLPGFEQDMAGSPYCEDEVSTEAGQAHISLVMRRMRSWCRRRGHVIGMFVSRMPKGGEQDPQTESDHQERGAALCSGVP